MVNKAGESVWIEQPRPASASLPLIVWHFGPGMRRIAGATPDDVWRVRWSPSLEPRRPLVPESGRAIAEGLSTIAYHDRQSGTVASIADAVVSFYQDFGPLGLWATLPQGPIEDRESLRWPENAEPLEVLLQEAHRAFLYYRLTGAALRCDPQERRQLLQEVIGPVPQGYVVTVNPNPTRSRRGRTLKWIEIRVHRFASENEALGPGEELFRRRLGSSRLVYDWQHRRYLVSIYPAAPADRRFKRWRMSGMSLRWLTPGFRRLCMAAEGTPGLGPAPVEEVEGIAGDLLGHDMLPTPGSWPAGFEKGPIAELYKYLAECLVRWMPWGYCRSCGRLIEKRRRGQRCCDQNCAKAWHDHLRHIRRHGMEPATGLSADVMFLFQPLVPRLRRCPNCDGPLGPRRRKFCSTECAGAWRKADWRRRKGLVTMPDARHSIAVPGDSRYMKIAGYTLSRPREMFWSW